jgi:hypothetical protein
MKAISMGLAKVVVDGTDLGSVTNASIDMQLDTVPIHKEKVGSAYIVGSDFAVKSVSGYLSVSTEEVGLVRGILDSMLAVLKGEKPEKKGFTCTFPTSGGSMSGQVLLLPQFTASVNADGWSSVTIQPMICGALGGSGGSVSTNMIGGVPFLNTTKTGALTTNVNNLCTGAECNSKGIGFLSVSASCQFTGIFRNNSPWPVDYVIDTASVTADIGFYDFADITPIFSESSPVSVKFLTLGGSGLTLDFGAKCVKVLAGMRTSNAGVNTWHIKVEGNAF